ncbi:alcohol dehydrogenase catalytic domain-containing protein [Agromyces sp. S2-1-8]|uniref:alcohol dehydrogenase catalytic domain-containing protein n=1 Tax=Agromyces sp. S2-1-8 TaxID=2897180 RepID=UPI001E354F04|nr:alcohol dehydrogenase catalytic domain-containing protein [Agromyces sp. S2-1-8]MCD5345698.1 alcohol dehydrogenase catalytic domain-containing protein [Agromyces sp. S2-1-8]
MRAAVLSAHGLDGLAVAERGAPGLAAGEVLVRVETVGVNQLDLNVIAGVGPGVAAKLPRVLGIDPAGEIVAVGDGVDPARLGEAVVVKPNIACGGCPACARGREADCPAQVVVGVHRDGGAADLVAVPARNAFPRGALPSAVATAAVHSVPIVLNAIETAGVAEGERVLVTGAGGTLGRAATALAAHLGADVVAASRGSLDEAPPGVRAIRADGTARLRAALAAEQPGGFDVVIDVSGHGPTLGAGVAALSWAGRAVFCAASVDPGVELDSRDFYLRRKRLIGVASADYAQVRRALDLVAAGAVTPAIGARYDLGDVRGAYRDFSDSPPGKVIIDVS